MIVFISGPQGCGKTKLQEKLLRHFNGKRIVDDWTPGDTRKLQDGDVALTNVAPEEIKAAKVVGTLPMGNVRFYSFVKIKRVLTGGILASVNKSLLDEVGREQRKYGSLTHIEDRIGIHKWQDRKGKDHHTRAYEINALQMLDINDDSAPGNGGGIPTNFAPDDKTKFATAAGDFDPIARQLERRLERKGVSHGLRK